MTLIGPFTMSMASGSDSSGVISASLVNAAESLTVFSPAVIEGDSVKLQGAPNLGVEFPSFVDLHIAGDESITPGGAITLDPLQGSVIRPVPAVAGFRLIANLAQSASINFDLLGRTAPGVNAANETFVTGSVLTTLINSFATIDVTGSVGVDQNAPTQSVSLVGTHVTQSVDIAAGDSINIEGTQSVVITNAIPQDVGANVSPGGVSLGSFASMSRREPV